MIFTKREECLTIFEYGCKCNNLQSCCPVTLLSLYPYGGLDYEATSSLGPVLVTQSKKFSPSEFNLNSLAPGYRDWKWQKNKNNTIIRLRRARWKIHVFYFRRVRVAINTKNWVCSSRRIFIRGEESVRTEHEKVSSAVCSIRSRESPAYVLT